jgi:hypothetical protein
MPITRQKSPVFSIVSLPTDSVIVDHAVEIVVALHLPLINIKNTYKIFGHTSEFTEYLVQNS